MTTPSQRLHAVSIGDVQQQQANYQLASALISSDIVEKYATFPGADADFPVFFFVEIDGNVSSYMRTIPDEVFVDRTKRRWAWTADNFTYPEFRNRGLSTTLQRWATDYLHDREIGRGSVFSTDVTLHTFEKLGFTLAGYAPRYLLLRTPRPYLHAKIRHPAVRAVFNGLAVPTTAAAIAGLRGLHRLNSSTTTCEEVEPTDQRWNDLLARSADSRAIHFDMSAETLGTKLSLAQRAGVCRLWLIADQRTNRSLAYLITRERFQTEPLAEVFRNFRLMTVMDFGFDATNIDAADAVAAHLMERFFKSTCEVLELVSTNRLLNRAVARRGMLRVGKGMSFNYSVPRSWNWSSDLAHADNWPLSNFCGDAFTF